jgi:hypothetical protein
MREIECFIRKIKFLKMFITNTIKNIIHFYLAIEKEEL